MTSTLNDTATAPAEPTMSEISERWPNAHSDTSLFFWPNRDQPTVELNPSSRDWGLHVESGNYPQGIVRVHVYGTLDQIEGMLTDALGKVRAAQVADRKEVPRA
jgi:hypothetical protein